jgi:general secretion pathway protein H
MVPSRRGCPRGFTLIEIILVLVLIGLIGSMVVPQGRTERGRFTHGMTTLILALNAAQERAAASGVPVGMALSEHGWQRMIYHLREGSAADQGWQRDTEAPFILPDDLELSLHLERQDIRLAPVLEADALPQLWFYPGGEMSVFTLTLRQGRCEWVLVSQGYISIHPQKERCDVPQTP